MKKIFLLFLYLILGIVVLTGCSANDEPFSQESYTIDIEDIKGVSIDVEDRFIEVSLSNDNQIHIGYFENSKESYDIFVSDDHILTMTTVSNKKWTDYIGTKSASENRKISLQIPDTLLASLSLSTTNEDILLHALTILNDISLCTNGGDISFDQLNVGNSITFRSKNGTISGTIIGSYDDYAISCDIKKGKSNLPSDKENGTKTLSAYNNNGNIDITFVNE